MTPISLTPNPRPFRTTIRTMKFDPLRPSTPVQANESQMSSPTENKPVHHHDSLNIHVAMKGMCEHHADTEVDGQCAMTPVSVTLDQATPDPATSSSLITSWDDLVRNGVGLGDGLGAPAAIEPDEVRYNENEEEEEKAKTWGELVQVQAVLGEDGSEELDMQRKEKLWRLF